MNANVVSENPTVWNDTILLGIEVMLSEALLPEVLTDLLPQPTSTNPNIKEINIVELGFILFEC
jgi:hypothetical protein